MVNQNKVFSFKIKHQAKNFDDVKRKADFIITVLYKISCIQCKQDQMLGSAASDLGLHCLPITLLGVSVKTYPAVHDIPTFANSVDPDQMASEEAIWSGSTLFSFSLWIWTKILFDVIWLADIQKWVWLIKLFSRMKVKLD